MKTELKSVSNENEKIDQGDQKSKLIIDENSDKHSEIIWSFKK